MSQVYLVASTNYQNLIIKGSTDHHFVSSDYDFENEIFDFSNFNDCFDNSVANVDFSGGSSVPCNSEVKSIMI